jgi:outer membrane protein OmpA-like peptidoglycan-associated protein
MKKSSFFWVGFSDLMTSLFFIMLVLYVVTFVKLKIDEGKLITELGKLNEIKNVEKALSTLDREYYSFDPDNKRYKLNIDVKFPNNGADIKDLHPEAISQLKMAGQELYGKINSLIEDNSQIEYLLIIEGNTQRSDDNWIRIPNVGYKLSYERALALFNFWKDNGIDFNKLKGQCEVIIAGSGYFGQSREAEEPNNRRFSIQVTSKVGKFLHEKDQEQLGLDEDI